MFYSCSCICLLQGTPEFVAVSQCVYYFEWRTYTACKKDKFKPHKEVCGGTSDGRCDSLMRFYVQERKMPCLQRWHSMSETRTQEVLKRKWKVIFPILHNIYSLLYIFVSLENITITIKME